MSDEHKQGAAEPTPASAAYAMQWLLPELPPQASHRERKLASKFTRVVAALDEDWPDAHSVWLAVGPQQFRLMVCETREDAWWHCWMLAKALAVVIDSAARCA